MNKDIFWIAPLVVLVIGLLTMPYGYYFLSRFVVCGCAIYYAVQFNGQSDTTLAWVFGFFAVLYNPIIPIHLGAKVLWIVVNIVTAGVFFVNKDKV
tara:strand:- start:583 stop:870 length:288 start_codon:yes stop_codon:yes gene_type:complete